MHPHQRVLAQSFARNYNVRYLSRNVNHPRLLSSTSRRANRRRVLLDIPPPFPVTKTCPTSCNCPTPAMPEGLPIDHEQALNGTMAAYAQQLVVCTGQRDWTSRIENDGENQGWGNLVRGLKSLLGRGGPYLDPFNNILVTASSLASTSNDSQTASGFLFPSFKYIPAIPAQALSSPEPTNLTTFVRAFLLPGNLHDMHSSLPESKQTEMTRLPSLASQFPDTVDIKHSPIILICGHGGRDMRCGVMAPALETQFQTVLEAHGFSSTGTDCTTIDDPKHAHIGLISHVGGHKYAGNIIVYIPPEMKMGSEEHPLAGKGIWYGRIEPMHVQGVVEETILGGKVVTDHFRGGIDRNGDILRM
ncbi:hypothetical protein N7488_009080 [Penicillium malachiteum]|nr:hypothetical protein N7488_009080 [Penicillium malachiteum]